MTKIERYESDAIALLIELKAHAAAFHCELRRQGSHRAATADRVLASLDKAAEFLRARAQIEGQEA